MNDASLIDDLLRSARTIAVVGYPERPDRPSNSVSRYLRAHGYRVIPVNPQLRGAVVEGERSYDRLADIPADVKVDLVDVFRRGEFLDAVVGDAITAGLPQDRLQPRPWQEKGHHFQATPRQGGGWVRLHAMMDTPL